MEDQDNVWYRLGYTMEKARSGARRAQPVRPLAERELPRKVTSEAEPRPAEEASAPGKWDAVVTAGAAALIGRLVEALPRKRKPGMKRLLRAGAAGAGAALIGEMIRSFRAGGFKKEDVAAMAKDALLSGTARGLLYGVLVEPRIPGPAVVRGAAYGYIEHLVTPMGGLQRLVGAEAPHLSVPLLSDLLDEIEPSEETLLEHILFGVTMAALYGALPAAAEDADEDEDDEDEDE